MKTNGWKSEGSEFHLDKSDNLPTVRGGSKTAALRSQGLIKRNEIELFLVRWMDLESVIQSEVSQKEKKTNTVC